MVLGAEQGENPTVAQQRLLIISQPGPLPLWSFSGFTVEHSSLADDPVRVLKAGNFDAVLLVVQGPQPVGACDPLLALCEEDALPLALAAAGDDEPGTRLLEQLPFDAFVDLRWDVRLVERCLGAMLQRVHAGRNLVQIQQHILSVARGEVTSLQHLAVRDELTGLYNLHHFREVVGKEHRRCERHGGTYAVVFLDLDNLKKLNTQHGHAAGARALVRVGQTLAAITRTCDYAFRIGGDEFVALIVESTTPAAATYAERVRQAVERDIYPEGQSTVELTLSAGCAGFPADGDTSEGVLANADRALFRAKELGKNRVVCYTHERGEPGVPAR